MINKAYSLHRSAHLKHSKFFQWEMHWNVYKSPPFLDPFIKNIRVEVQYRDPTALYNVSVREGLLFKYKSAGDVTHISSVRFNL